VAWFPSSSAKPGDNARKELAPSVSEYSPGGNVSNQSWFLMKENVSIHARSRATTRRGAYVPTALDYPPEKGRSFPPELVFDEENQWSTAVSRMIPGMLASSAEAVRRWAFLR
jgi:hypothetical protein